MSETTEPRRPGGSHSWCRPVVLSGPGSTGSPGGTHPLVSDGDIVHAVWEHWGTLLYRRSEDAGRTWGETRPVTTGGTAAYPCSLELEGAAVHLIWPDGRHGGWEVFHRRSDDGGGTWREERRLTPGIDLFRLGTAAAGRSLHVVWGSRRLVNPTPAGAHTWGEIYHLRSLDGGETWSQPLRLTESEATAMRPSVTVVDRLVHLLWFDRRGAKRDWDWDIYYRRSTDCGQTWEREVRLTHTPTHARHPLVAADEQGRVCCLWEDGSFFDGTRWGGDAALYACVSQDGGGTWGETRRLTVSPMEQGRATHSKSYACGSRLHLAWADSRTGASGRLVPFYMSSPDCGLTWTEPEQLLEPAAEDRYPAGVVGTDAYALVTFGAGDTLYYLRRDLPRG